MQDGDIKYLSKVRAQYEGYPYPGRDPADEKQRLLATSIDALGKISHYGFSGRKDLRQGSRLLVAGGGTGDAVIYLAEQLRGTDSELCYLDISNASMNIARQRAEVRGLDNIEWIHDSLLNLPDLSLKPFDFINCSGVLHHLEDPTAGLQALTSVLRDDGCLGLMVYAQYGRTGVYQAQELMRRINNGEPDVQRQIDNARLVLDELPPSNWFRHQDSDWIDEIERYGDIGIYDILLHTQDRAYTVPELYELLESVDLNLLAWVGPAGSRRRYDPLTYISDPELSVKIGAMPCREQEAIAELLDGGIRKHAVYASRHGDSAARSADLDQVPYCVAPIPTGEKAYHGLKNSNDQSFQLRSPNSNIVLTVIPDLLTKFVLRHLDGNRCLREIFDTVLADADLPASDIPTDDALLKSFDTFYRVFNNADLMFLRHRSIPPYRTQGELHSAMLGS